MSADGLRQDIAAGIRIFRSAPTISLTTIVLIAIVIGGNTTVYSLVHSLMVKPASGIADGARLVTVQHLQNGSPVGPAISYAEYEDLTARSSSISELLAWRFDAFTAGFSDGTYAMRGVSVSGNYFPTLGVQLARGRTFTDAETRLDGTGLTAIISYRVWQDHFGGRDDALGASLVVNGQPATIVGVAPASFHGLMLGEQSDIYVPLVAYARATATEAELRQRDRRSILAIGRLAAGATLSQVRAEFATISAQLSAAYPDTDRDHAMSAVPYSLTAAGDSLFATRAPQFLAVFSLVTLLTLGVVCANIGNLMLARVITRQRELAVRLSLGATRTRVIRLLVGEGIVLSFVAWLAACGFAWGLSRLLVRFVATGSASSLTLVDFTPDWLVLTYAMALAIAGTVAFSLAPAVRVWRQDLLSSLKPGEAGTSALRSRVSRGLAIVQLAFCVLLLVVAGLGYRSLRIIGTSSLGFDPEPLLLVRVNASNVSNPGKRGQVIADAVRHLATLPGVSGVASARVAPPNLGTPAVVRTTSDGRPVVAQQNEVGPGFFSVLNVHPAAGREFVPADADREAAGAVINVALADTLWPGESAIGRTLLLGERQQPHEIVGVVPDARYLGFQGDTRPAYLFLPDTQRGRGFGLATLYVRHDGSTDAVGPRLRTALRDFNAGLPIVSMMTMNAAIEDSTSPIRIITILLTIFATGSLAIAAIGLYGVISFSMRRRTREFGVRIALGASAADVVRSVLHEGAVLAAAGTVVGFVLSAAVATAARRLLFGVTPTDVPTYLSVFLLLTVVALAASYLPARRASRIAPAIALREE